jgi:hypothetical protein
MPDGLPWVLEQRPTRTLANLPSVLREKREKIWKLYRAVDYHNEGNGLFILGLCKTNNAYSSAWIRTK